MRTGEKRKMAWSVVREKSYLALFAAVVQSHQSSRKGNRAATLSVVRGQRSSVGPMEQTGPTDSPRSVLGVDETASPAEVRSAYLDLARAHHPDRFVERTDSERRAADHRMQAINEAWSAFQREARQKPPSTAFRSSPGQTAPTAGPRYRHGASATNPYQGGGSLGAGPGGPWLMWGLWPLALLIGVLGLIFVVSAIATARASDPASSQTGGATTTTAIGGLSAVPPLGARGQATPNQAAVLGQCVKTRDGVVIATVACTPDADGVVEAAIDRGGRCADGRPLVFHPDITLMVCVRDFGG